MKQKTIIYIGGFELPDKNAAAHRVLNNSKIFRELGYRVILAGINKKTHTTYCDMGETFICEFYEYPNTIKKWIHVSTSIEFIKILVEKYSNIKFIIAYDYPAIALYRLIKFGHKIGVKIWADCTEWYPFGYGNYIWQFLKFIDTTLRMRFVQKKCDGIIVISKYLQEYYKKYNTILLPPLVDKNDPKWMTKAHNKMNEKIELVYAGSPFGKDQLQNLIKIVAKFNGKIWLKIVGITSEEYAQHTKSNKCDMQNFITFFGRVSHLQAIDLILHSDASIFFREPCRQTNAGFPTKFVESISCGVPVITNDTSDLSLYIGKDANGIIIKNITENEIFDGIVRFIQKKEKISVDAQVFDYKNYIERIEEYF